MRTQFLARASLVLAGMALAVPAWAVPGQATTPIGAATANACVGNGFSGFNAVGNSINGGVSSSSGAAPTLQQMNCVAGTSAVGGQVTTGALSTSGTYNGHPYSNAAQATAGIGVIKLQSSNTGSAATGFSGAAAQGGWNDTVTMTGGVNGTQGLLVVPIHVHGLMDSVGLGANGLMEVGIYRNHAVVQPYGLAINQAAYTAFQTLNTAFNPHINQNSVAVGTVLFGWDYQMKPYGAVDYGPGALTTTSLSIDEVVRFVIPFTWGQAVDIGLYAAVQSYETASGADTTINTASAQFQNTIYWDKGVYALAADGSGPAITNFTISAASGANYAEAFVPEPASLTLLGVGSVLLTLVRRRAKPDRRGATHHG